MSVEIQPPRAVSEITIDGYEIPYLEFVQEQDGRMGFILDRRYGSPCVSKQEFEWWASFIANAMAVAAGYSCHGEAGNPTNPFKRRLTGIRLPPNLRVVPKDDDGQQ